MNTAGIWADVIAAILIIAGLFLMFGLTIARMVNHRRRFRALDRRSRLSRRRGW